MVARYEAYEGAVSAPLAVASLDKGDSELAYLVFDQCRRVIHASRNTASILKLPEELMDPEEGLMSVLKRTTGGDLGTLHAAKEWLERQERQASPSTHPPLVLLTTRGSRTLHARLSRLGDGFWIATFEDVTERLNLQNNLIPMVHQDRMTGIGNRSHFEESVDRRLECVGRSAEATATILFLDLDRFKVVNDTLGHAVGDALLRTVSERLVGALRNDDTLARLGGDEFGILLAQGSGKIDASALATRIIDLIQRPYMIEGHVINVGASIGIATAPAHGQTRDQLLKRADLALYHSKGAGRGVFNFFEPAMEERAQKRRSLELELRKALPLRQFELHYQPQIDVETQQVSAFKALLRWRHPQRGLLDPGEFLSVAEEIGLAGPIGNWVLKAGCKEALRWPPSVTIALNISPLQFEAGKFEQSVEQALRTAGLPGARLEIEVTEAILSHDGPTILETLNALHSLGVAVTMDNFGVGLASLSQLVNFPFDKIKIDRSLISTQVGGAKSRAIVRAISALGQSLGISTLAEGIESSDQLAQVRSDGCQTVQGFYYSKTISSTELLDLFSTGSPGSEFGPCESRGAA